VDARGVLQVGEKSGDAARSLTIEDRHRLARVAVEDLVAEACHTHLDGRGGGGDRQLEGERDEHERRPEPQEDLEEDAAHHQPRLAVLSRV